MPEFHTAMSWTLSNGRGSYYAELVVETTDSNSVAAAFEEWCRRGGE